MCQLIARNVGAVIKHFERSRYFVRIEPHVFVEIGRSCSDVLQKSDKRWRFQLPDTETSRGKCRLRTLD